MKNDFEIILKKSNHSFSERVNEIIKMMNEELSVMDALIRELKEDYSDYKIGLTQKRGKQY